MKKGVGLAIFHGGINWFEDEEYYKMIGALYLYDTSSEEYVVTITDRKHPIIEGLNDFTIISENIMCNKGNMLIRRVLLVKLL